MQVLPAQAKVHPRHPQALLRTRILPQATVVRGCIAAVETTAVRRLPLRLPVLTVTGRCCTVAVIRKVSRSPLRTRAVPTAQIPALRTQARTTPAIQIPAPTIPTGRCSGGVIRQTILSSKPLQRPQVRLDHLRLRHLLQLPRLHSQSPQPLRQCQRRGSRPL